MRTIGWWNARWARDFEAFSRRSLTECSRSILQMNRGERSHAQVMTSLRNVLIEAVVDRVGMKSTDTRPPGARLSTLLNTVFASSFVARRRIAFETPMRKTWCAWASFIHLPITIVVVSEMLGIAKLRVSTLRPTDIDGCFVDDIRQRTIRDK